MPSRTSRSRPSDVPRRESALDAALQILGEQGLRALSHARVDDQAGLPRGSTSNHFRSRRALLDGVVGHLAALEKADFGGATPLRHRDRAVAAFTAMLEAQAGPFRHRTLARYALFVDAAHDRELLAPLLENRRGFELWTTSTLLALEAPDPLDATKLLMATLDGLLLHRLTVDPDLELAPKVARVIDWCLAD